jgi:hypothetical protein
MARPTAAGAAQERPHPQGVTGLGAGVARTGPVDLADVVSRYHQALLRSVGIVGMQSSIEAAKGDLLANTSFATTVPSFAESPVRKVLPLIGAGHWRRPRECTLNSRMNGQTGMSGVWETVFNS